MQRTLKPIEAGELELGKLLAADYEFEIPDYQRPYSWGADESLQLLDDLTAALDRDTDEPYFLGSVVLVKEKGVPRSEVIDGQQRLTTLTLLLATLRDLAEDADLRSHIHRLVEEPEVVWSRTPARPRLRLRQRDDRFFREYVQTPGATEHLIELSDNVAATDSQKALRDNVRALRARLATWPPERRADLFVMLGARTFLVVVSTTDLNSAYRIFSVMNARGLPLTPSDIIKSQVIGAIRELDREEYAERWEDLEEDLGRSEFGDLFLHLRTIATKSRARRNLLEEFRQVLDDYLPDQGREFISELLEPYAQASLRLNNQDFDGGSSSDSINAWLKRLNQLDNDDWRPAALWGLVHHGDDPLFLDEFLRRLERLSASMHLRRVYTTPRVQRHLELLRQLEDGEGLTSPAFDLSNEEKAETRSRLDGEIYLVPKIRRFVLLRLDSVLAKDPGASYSHHVISVEHVLPQHPRAGSEWTEVFDDEARAHWTHRLGNLLLLNRTKNAEAQNFEFLRKRERYFTGRNGSAVFALTTQVLAESEWTPAVLERRQALLTSTLCREWDLT